MSNKQSEQPWHAKIVGGGPIGESGDYDDGYWEITNGKTSFFTNDDDQSASSEETEDQWARLTSALNESKANFWIDDSWMLELSHYKEGVADKDKEIARITNLFKNHLTGGCNCESCASLWNEIKDEYKL